MSSPLPWPGCGKPLAHNVMPNATSYILCEWRLRAASCQRSSSTCYFACQACQRCTFFVQRLPQSSVACTPNGSFGGNGSEYEHCLRFDQADSAAPRHTLKGRFLCGKHAWIVRDALAMVQMRCSCIKFATERRLQQSCVHLLHMRERKKQTRKLADLGMLGVESP